MVCPRVPTFRIRGFTHGLLLTGVGWVCGYASLLYVHLVILLIQASSQRDVTNATQRRHFKVNLDRATIPKYF